LRYLALVAFFVIVVAKNAAAAEGALWCEHADECEPVEATTWQTPPPADVPCSDEMFSSAVGICEGEVADEAPEPKPPLTCDGASCFPTDAPVPPVPPTFSYSHPFALAAVWRAPALRGAALVPAAERPLEDGFPRRLERPPRVSL
jgi:hypothetical protein